MKRHAWLVVSLAALFGLRAPLCVYACASPGDSVALEAADPAPAPCHGSEGPAESPRPGGRACECDCDTTRLVTTKGSPEPPATAALEIPGAGSASAPDGLPGRVAAASPLRRGEHLPAPDVLLLKSTLLI